MLKIPFFNLYIGARRDSPKSYYSGGLRRSSGWSASNMTAVYDGEKTPYEMGNPYNFELDYYTMRARGWEAFLNTDVVQNAIHKYCLWIVGSGLKLQSDPNDIILNKKGITSQDIDNFTRDVEANFRIFSNSKFSTYSQNYDMHTVAAESLKNAIISGDVLCLLRVTDDERVVIDIIDGHHVQNPLMSDYYAEAADRGNKIKEGVEIDRKGRHVAYYVASDDMKYQRIPAYGEQSGQRMAWLMYGRRYKIDSVRGMSYFSAVLENASKLDRYKDATVGTAEENAKIPYSIEHNQYSDGENPMINQLAQTMSDGKGVAPETETDYADAAVLAAKIAKQTSKYVYNMPRGATIKRNEFKADNQFKDFFLTNIDIFYATLGIPAEVALDKFGGSYSSSRAALKSWEYNMFVSRTNILQKQFYSPIYNVWMDVNVFNNKINAPGYLEALMMGDVMTLEAYRNCRFIGATVPHIDPEKEVKAERAKLGDKFDSVPLTTAEQSCENLNTGDFENISKKTKYEKDIAPDFVTADDGGDGSV